MGEDKTKSTEVAYTRHRRSSVMSSSCSESESTSAGYPDDPDERDEELEYGPGIVHKLRTKYISITLKQNRGTNMRRSCSMENLLDQDRPFRPIEKNVSTTIVQTAQPWGHLKRAKSMDTLLMELHPVKQEDEDKKPKIIKRVDGGLTRPVPSICDEELPKPDTVKTYKRMFEPAESKRGSYCRRPPVLRASAKSCGAAKMNGTLSNNTSAKLNGSTSLKSKISAKQSSKVQLDSVITPIHNSIKKPIVTEGQSRPLYNGCHVVKATPVKINSSHRNCKDVLKNNCMDVEKNINSLNRLMNKKEINFPLKNDLIHNDNNSLKDILKLKSTEETVKQLTKTINSNGYSVVNGKPKVPPNRPVLKNPKPFFKVDQNSVNRTPSPKPKPNLVNGIKKLDVGYKSDIVQSSLKRNNVITEKRIENDFKNLTQSKSLIIYNKSEQDLNVTVIPNSSSTVPDLASADLNLEFKTNDTTSQINKPQPEKPKEVVMTSPEHLLNVNKTVCESSNPEFNNTNKPICTSPTPEPNTTDKTTYDIPSIAIKNVNPTCESPTPGVNTISKLNCESPTSGLETINIVNDETPGPENVNKPLSTPPIHEKKINQNGIKPEFRPKSPPSQEASIKSVKKSNGPSPTTSMVFDFRGKNVVPHVAVNPAPFGCKGINTKKRTILVDGKEVPNGTPVDEEDEDLVDYSVPPPCGLVFEGENVKVGRGSILSKRNKDLKITFDDDMDNNTFVYPSETSLLEDTDKATSPTASEIIPNGPTNKLKNNTTMGSSNGGGLSAYTPSVLRTVDNFEPGMFRPHPEKEPELKENGTVEEEENSGDQLLKPADPHLISSWSISAGTSDLLF